MVVAAARTVELIGEQRRPLKYLRTSNTKEPASDSPTLICFESIGSFISGVMNANVFGLKGPSKERSSAAIAKSSVSPSGETSSANFHTFSGMEDDSF